MRLLIISLVALFLLPATAQAQSAWVKRCEDTRCEIVQRLMDQESKSRVLEMAIGFPPGKDSARGVIILPLGVDLSQPFSLTIDEGTPLGFKVRYCLGDGCYAFLTLPPDVLTSMKKGTLGVLTFKTFDGQPGRLPLALDGFAASLSQIQKQ
jgi:invasion protein IalB